MSTLLEQLVSVRSALVEEVLTYLEVLSERAAELPTYYPLHLRVDEAGGTHFDAIRQRVQVVEDRTALEQWFAQEQERRRAAGEDVDRLAYAPRRARPEAEGDERDWDRPHAPSPLPWDEHAGERFRRAIILGDPGFGKTWLLRYEARRLARAAGAQLRAQTLDLDALVLPLFLRLSDLNRRDDPIEDALVALVGERRSEAFRRFVREKLDTERCVVLLDGWDEVPVEDPKPGQPIDYRPQYRQRLGQRLEAFSRQFPKPRVLLASRIVGYGGSPIPAAQELELLAFDSPQVEAFVSIWFRSDTEEAQRFLHLLRANAQVRGLTRIPLILTLMCRAYAEKQLAFPTRRVELYERCLRGLLRDWKEERHPHGETSDAYVEAVLELLQEVGYRLFTEGHEQFPEKLLRQEMIPCLKTLPPKHELNDRTPASLIAELKRDGVFIKAGAHRDAPLLFLHRTFHEHLTARALAASARQDGWAAISTLIDKKAWSPQWSEVVVLLAGQLADSAPLLKLLTNEKKDDCFRHRLALTALCLPELSAEIRTRVSGLVDRITTAAYSLWWQYKLNDTVHAVPHLDRVLPALVQVNGRMHNMPLLERLCYDWRFYDWGLEEEKRAQQAAASAAAEVVAKLGLAGATPDILTCLARLLEDGNRLVRRAAARTIVELGSVTATPDILPHLICLLGDKRTLVREAAVEAVGNLGPAAATPDILTCLARLLGDEDSGVRGAAAGAVWYLGPAAATPDILTRLARLLEDWNCGLRGMATLAVGDLGPVAATPDILTCLAHLLTDEDRFVREAAAETMGKLGPVAATPDILPPHLICLLGDKRTLVRGAAAEAMGKLEPAAATPDILTCLARLLGDEDSSVRCVAAEAMGRLGPVAATPDILTRLAHLLTDEDRDVREAAAQAVWYLGPAAATPDILTRLARLLGDEDSSVRCVAAEAMGRLGPAAATPDILTRLAHLLTDEDRFVREAAARAVWYLGPAAATPDILTRLGHLLTDENWYDWNTAAWTVKRLMAQGVRIFRVRGQWKGLMVDELSRL